MDNKSQEKATSVQKEKKHTHSQERSVSWACWKWSSTGPASLSDTDSLIQPNSR